MKLTAVVSISFLVSVFLLTSSCTRSTDKKRDKTRVVNSKSSSNTQDDITYAVVNATLKKLIPIPAKGQTDILVYERFLVADTQLIDAFIKRGGNQLLLQLNRKNAVYHPLSFKRVKHFNAVNILDYYPITTSEWRQLIGAVIYSRIILSPDKTKASFIFHFERLHDRKSKILCAVDVVNKQGDWTIVKKVCLENHSGMLYE